MQQTYWIQTLRRQEIGEALVLTHEQTLARHAIAVMQRRAHLFVGIQEVQWVLEKAARDYPNLVGEAIKAVPILKMADVLRRLLEEQVPIRNIRSIMESMAAWGAKEKDTLMLTEYVRSDLGSYLAHRASGGSATLQAVMLESGLEQTVRQAIKQTPAGNFLALPPETMEKICSAVLLIAGEPQEGRAVVTSIDVRRYVRKMIEKQAEWLHVYSFQELGGHVELRSLGRAQI